MLLLPAVGCCCWLMIVVGFCWLWMTPLLFAPWRLLLRVIGCCSCQLLWLLLMVLSRFITLCCYFWSLSVVDGAVGRSRLLLLSLLSYCWMLWDVVAAVGCR